MLITGTRPVIRTTRENEYCGKSNRSKIHRIAKQLTKEAFEVPMHHLPDWAGIAWIIDPYYNSCWRVIAQAKGEQWMERARRVAKALDLHVQAMLERREEARINEAIRRQGIAV
jgi:hypothetical protein